MTLKHEKYATYLIRGRKIYNIWTVCMCLGNVQLLFGSLKRTQLETIGSLRILIICAIREVYDVYFTLGKLIDNAFQTAWKYVASYFFVCIFSKTMRRRCLIIWTTFMYSKRAFSFCSVCAMVCKHPVVCTFKKP